MSLTFKDSKKWGMISNQLTASLVGSDGNVLWMCMPRFDSDPIIAYMLDEDNGGKFSIMPKEEYTSEQKYAAPNILSTVFRTAKGTCTVTDFLPPGKTMLVRDVRSDIELELQMQPTFSFGNSGINYSENEGFGVFDNASGDDRVVTKIEMNVAERNGNVYTLSPGNGHVAMAYYVSREVFNFPAEREMFQAISKILEPTIEYWNSKIKLDIDGIKSSGVPELDRVFNASIQVVLGLVYSPSGGIIAAPTTSLPEDPGGVRNWDYRFVWVRDCSIMASSLCDVEFVVEGRRALEFLFGLVDFSGKPFYNLYKVNGSRIYGEKYMNNLSGFMGSKPIKAGNRASNQIQLDIEGEFMDAVYHYFGKTKDTEFIKAHAKAIEYIGDWLSDNWQLTDSSIWEKTDDKEYTYSKVMMWVALDRAGKLLSVVGEKDKWVGARALIKSWVMSNCVKNGHFVVEPNSQRVDATPLLFPLYGFMDVNDPVFVNTLSLIEKTLVKNDFVFRYVSDSLGKSLHAFSLCSSWLSSVYSKMGNKKRAKDILINLARLSGPLGLIGEDIDVGEMTFTGNFPQGFSHAGFIQAFLELQS